MLMEEIRRAPVEGTVVEIPSFTRCLAPSQVVGNGISEPSRVMTPILGMIEIPLLYKNSL